MRLAPAMRRFQRNLWQERRPPLASACFHVADVAVHLELEGERRGQNALPKSLGIKRRGLGRDKRTHVVDETRRMEGLEEHHATREKARPPLSQSRSC